MSWQKTVLNQYSASQKLLSVIATFEQAVSLEDFTDRFLDEVWDITTCNRFGLDMWGKSSTFHVTSRRKSITARLGLRRQTKEKRIIPPRSVMPLITRGVQENQKNPASGQRLSKPDTQQGVF
ncbi:DUF2612 domain-containing protein [Candidatus Arsenophonus triatominarum]|uniref:DUF2612 domain-containing protein n=1 Tax=Candidatus Arsenophonus triatominarum TaxID=57911 RepID=UPI000B2BCE47